MPVRYLNKFSLALYGKSFQTNLDVPISNDINALVLMTCIRSGRFYVVSFISLWAGLHDIICVGGAKSIEITWVILNQSMNHLILSVKEFYLVLGDF